MKVVYFSHAGNTHRFVQERLMPALKATPYDWKDGAGFQPPMAHRITSPGPQRESDDFFKDKTGEKIVVVFPIYARGDYETGNVKDTVPAVMKQFIAANRESIIAAVVSGNRTFGVKYGYVDPDELDGIPLIYAFELSGGRTDAMNVREILRAANQNITTTNPDYQTQETP